MESPSITHKTPLNDAHINLGAKMIEFAGYEMPVWYNSQTEEHMAVRKSVGVFDLTHMGEFFFHGKGSLDVIQMLTTNDVAKLTPGKAQYSTILNDNAGIRDDVIVYRVGDEDYMIVVNAANVEKIDHWIREKLSADVFVNRSYEIALIAPQGPKAQWLLESAFGLDGINLEYFGVKAFTWNNIPITIARTGYTGEDGFEVFVENEYAQVIWDRFLETGGEELKPCGLAARDTLRLEVCYSLYGNELTEETNPYEAGLGWVVKSKKGDFFGKEKLKAAKKAGIKKRIKGMILDSQRVPRHGAKLFFEENEVGFVTSGCFSPVLDANIAIGYLPATADFEPGGVVELEIRDRRFKAKIVKTPFYLRDQ